LHQKNATLYPIRERTNIKSQQKQKAFCNDTARLEETECNKSRLREADDLAPPSAVSPAHPSDIAFYDILLLLLLLPSS
jgi:hypothetical protein